MSFKEWKTPIKDGNGAFLKFRIDRWESNYSNQSSLEEKFSGKE